MSPTATSERRASTWLSSKIGTNLPQSMARSGLDGPPARALTTGLKPGALTLTPVAGHEIWIFYSKRVSEISVFLRAVRNVQATAAAANRRLAARARK